MTLTPTKRGSADVPPAPMTLTCRAVRVEVLHAGAKLIGEGPGDDRSHRWLPSTIDIVPALKCSVNEEREPLVFVAPRKNGAPGIEWAYENSDSVVQTGAYRWMPSTP